MPDQYTEVTKRGYGNRLVGSIKGILTGFILLIVSIGILYWNEGRVDIGDIAENAVQISASQATSEENGTFVTLTGTVMSQETLGDDLYLLPGNYLALNRSVEVYAWEQSTSSETETKFGGGEETETTYNYKRSWVGNPASSSGFKIPEGHENSSKSIEDLRKVVSTAKIGIYDLQPSKIGIPGTSPLTLTEEIVDLGIEAELVGGFIFISNSSDFFEQSTFSAPEVGDLRISYTAVDNSIAATVFGQLEGKQIVPYFDEKNDKQVYFMSRGSSAQAIEGLHKSYSFTLWLFRFIGFFLMWIGLKTLLAPLSVLLDVIPFLGSVSRAVVGMVSFVVSLALSIIIILISMFLHSLIAVIVVGLALVLGSVYYLKTQVAKSKPATPHHS